MIEARIETTPPDLAYPVSVVIPHTDSRLLFFERFCLPSVRSARPAQIIVVRGEGGAAAKRNFGAAKATSPYLLLWDDDCIMACDFLKIMHAALEASPKDVGYAYCDALEVTTPDAPRHPISSVLHRKSQPWNEGALRKANYISNMSLMRREAFPGCDESLRRLIDWDMWLTLMERGVKGVYVPGIYYHAYYLDRGVTTGSVDYKSAVAAVRRKHPR